MLNLRDLDTVEVGVNYYISGKGGKFNVFLVILQPFSELIINAREYGVDRKFAI